MVTELSAPELVEESKYWRTNSAAKIGKNIEAQMKMRKMMKKMHFYPKSDKLWNKNIIFAANNFSVI